MITKKRRAELVVVVSDAVLGDDDGKLKLLGEIGDRTAERAGVNGLTDARQRQAWHRLMAGEEHSGCSEVERHGFVGVVVQTQVRERSGETGNPLTMTDGTKHATRDAAAQKPAIEEELGQFRDPSIDA
jgi:hypothetical protein